MQSKQQTTKSLYLPKMSIVPHSHQYTTRSMKIPPNSPSRSKNEELPMETRTVVEAVLHYAY
jgi:hypothetical protein